MQRQIDFDAPPIVQTACKTEDAPRLNRQCMAILERLQQGPVTNDELSRMARKYTSRVSEIRKVIQDQGGDVVCFNKDAKTGLAWYRLELSRNALDHAGADKPTVRREVREEE